MLPAISEGSDQQYHQKGLQRGLKIIVYNTLLGTVSEKQGSLCTCQESNLVQCSGTSVTFKSPLHEPCEFFERKPLSVLPFATCSSPKEYQSWDLKKVQRDLGT